MSRYFIVSIIHKQDSALPQLWQHHILQIPHDLDLRGSLPILLQNYLQNRSFCVRVATTPSSPHNQTNGNLRVALAVTPYS